MKPTYKINKKIAILTFFFFIAIQTNFIAQQLEVKGVVFGKGETETETLSGANIYLKGTAIGTSTNKKGEFTFPQKLKMGDVLVVSYLGYLKKEIKINQTATNIRIYLDEDQNEMLGALQSNKPFKSKRKN